jgi:hypothetical protein
MITEERDMCAKEAIGVSILERRTVKILDPNGSESITLDELAQSSRLTIDGRVYRGVRGHDGLVWSVCVAPEGEEGCTL